MKVFPVLVAAALALALAGCVDEPQSVAGASGEPETWVAYGEALRSGGNVTVEEDGGSWLARQRVGFTNGAGNATALEAALESFNGDLHVTGWSNSTVHLAVDLWARAGSENQARRSLESLDVSYDDHLHNDRFGLAAEVTVDGGVVSELLYLFFATSDQGASMHLHAPWDLLADLELATTNGAIGVGGIGGGLLDATTSNGAITALGGWDDLQLDTRNGAIVVRTEAANSGTYDLATTNGAIELNVNDGEAHGFDVVADTSNAAVEIDLQDTEELSDGHDRHVRTNGFQSKPIRTSVELVTSNGAITVTGRG